MAFSKFPPTIFGPSHLVELVQYRAAIQPHDPAFIYLANGIDDELALSNAELDRRAREIAVILQGKKCEGERILLLYPPGLDFITAFFGCLYAGAIAIPVYPPRRNRSVIRIQAVAQNASAKIALTTQDILNRAAPMITDSSDLNSIPWLATDTLTDIDATVWNCPNIDANTIAFLQYTSGSTGTPKGVILSHGNLIHNSHLIQQGFEHTRHDLGVFWLPSYHDMGLIGGILQPLYCGRTNVIMSPLSFLQKPFRWLAAITRYGATTSGGPNFAYELCVKQIKDEQLEQLDLSSWKVAFNGAEPIQAETLEKFAKKFERCGFRYNAFYPCFGLAEATLIVSGGYASEPPLITAFDGDSLARGKIVEVERDSSKGRRYVSSGRNFNGQTIRIVNPETGELSQPNEVGEVWVQGPSIAQGYWQNQETSEETFHAVIANRPEEGWYMRTGDLGFLFHDELFITGRIKDLIIIRGVNVYPQDIEETVQKTDPNLRTGCGGAFMLASGAAERLVIVQEVERRFKDDCASFFEPIRKAVAREHEIPVDAIVLVKSGTVPKTSSGKIQRHACKNGFLDGTLTHLAFWSAPDSPLSYVPQASEEDNTPKAEKSDSTKMESPTPNLQPPAHNPQSTIHKPQIPSHSFAESLRREKEATLKRFQSAGIEPGSTAVSQTSPVPAMPREKLNEKLPIGTTEELIVTILDVVRTIGKDRALTLDAETDLTSIGLDSLERMEILASLEDRFGGRFPEHILSNLFTAKQVADAIKEHLGADKSPYASIPETESDTKVEEITPDRYRIEEFPECKQMHDNLLLVQKLGLNHFFDVHEGITNDRTVINGKEYINFSSYNYVNTSGDPAVVKAAQEACAKYGTSVSASRLVSGEKPLHRELEAAISRFLGTEDTIVMVGGHSTNESVIGHLFSAEDLILHDSLAHNSIVEGAMLSGARRRPFPHNDWEAADKLLQKFRADYRRVLLVVEGVYSMDGDYPDLAKLIEVKKRHKTLLMVDEAHSLGVLGKTGRGIGELFNVKRSDVDLWMCTLSKTFGSCGGYISGSTALVEFLKYTVPGFVFSVGISPPNAAAALASLKVLEREPQRVEKLRQNSKLFLELAREKGLDTGTSKDSAVVPAIIGNSLLCLKLSKALFDHGINVQPILHPAVEEKAARLRFFITCAHNEEQIRLTVDTTAKLLEELRNS